MGEKEHLIIGLKEFLKKVSKDFKIEKFLLFGSRARKDFSEDSDIDLIIVSKDFEEIGFFDRVKKMHSYWEIDLPVDFICYTLKEFNDLKKRITIVREALKEGIEIK